MQELLERLRALAEQYPLSHRRAGIGDLLLAMEERVETLRLVSSHVSAPMRAELEKLLVKL
jgi:hypothetical protein